MRRLITIIALLFFACGLSYGQAKDDFGGLISVSCTANPHTLNFTTGSQAGTTQTLTITGPSVGQTWQQANHVYSYGDTILDSGHHWQRVVIAGTSGGSIPAFNDGAAKYTADNTVEWGDWGPEVAVNEPMIISGTGTAMDWSFSGTSITAGEGNVATVNLSTGIVTLTASASNTVTGPVSGTIVYGGYYVSTVNTKNWGTGPQLCTPERHWQWFAQMSEACANQGACPMTINFNTKYGSLCAGALSEWTLWKTWNFNAVGEVSDNAYYPGPGGSCSNAKIPYGDLDQGGTGSYYATSNYGGYAIQPPKLITYMLGVSDTDHPRTLLDHFDPRLSTFVLNFVQFINASYTQFYQTPWIAFYATETNDNAFFMNGGYDFHSAAASPENDFDYGYQVLISAPFMSGTNIQSYGNGEAPPVIYPDPLNYSKTPMASPPTSCGLVTDQAKAPCPLATFLSKKYGTVGALNSAYGSTYTTFNSSGTQYGYSSPISSWYINGGGTTTICTGTGASASCSGTLNHGTNGVSIYSVALYYTPSGGSPIFVGFDCPNTTNSGCTASSGVGKLFTPGRWRAGHSYPTGQIVTDSNGGMEQLQTAGVPACATSGSEPAWATTIGNTTSDNTCTWKLLGAGLTAVGGTSTSTITYATGAVSLVATGNIQNGAVWSAAYTTDGFGLGTGFLDEGGQNAWVTNNGVVCVTVPPAYQVGHAYTITDEIQDSVTGTWQVANKTFTSSSSNFSTLAGTLTNDGSTVNAWMSLGHGVCQTGGDYPAPTINASLGQDLETWLGDDVAQWNAAVSSVKRQLWPEFLDFGIDDTGNFNTPPKATTLQAGNLYWDGTYHNSTGYNQNVPTYGDYQAALKYQFFTRYFHGPMIDEQFLISNQSPQTCTGCFDTQVNRARGWYTSVLEMLTTLSFNGTQQNAGVAWFGSHPRDGACPGNNWWGLQTCNDNAFDGTSDVTGTVTCPPPQQAYSCGGESSASWNGANAWGSATQNPTTANALWFTGNPVPPAPATQMMVRK